ncbi:MAG TPA: ATP-binding protein [Myxococcota bacterium]|nr:ATP-binding protein [Myxococcota bacterium]
MLLHLKHYVLRHWRRLTDPSGALNDTFVSIHEALHTLGAARDEVIPEGLEPHQMQRSLDAIDHDIIAWRHHIAQRLAVTSLEVELPLELLGDAFALSDLELDLLVALALAQTDLDFIRLCTFAWADLGRKQPDVAFLVDLFSRSPEQRAEALRCVEARSPLFSRRLVSLFGRHHFVGDTPRLFRIAVAEERVIAYLLDGREALALLPEGMRFREVRRSPMELDLKPNTLGEALGLWAAVGRGVGPRWIVSVSGPTGVGRRTLLSSLAAMNGQTTLEIDVTGRASETLDALLGTLDSGLREAGLQRAIPVFDLGPGVTHLFEAHEEQLQASLARLFSPVRAVVAFVSKTPQRWLGGLGTLFELHIPYTPSDEQANAWSRGLTHVKVTSGGRSGLDARYLANRFNLTAGQIQRAIREATGRNGVSEGGAVVVSEAALIHAARAQVTHNLSALATPVQTNLGWDDLILPDETLAQLREIERSLRLRSKVFDTWGFSRLTPQGQGIKALFGGPPGTGKTLAASVIGKSLGREVYRVDLSRIVDKYIGETEKHLSRLFDESEHAQVVLLFDEADSLFASRTSVQSVHDRHANLQVNFLLQRIESYEGFVVLTTNYEDNIDEAFRRRLQAWVRFQKPDARQRAALWRSMLPSSPELTGKIDVLALANEFDFSGGHIKNAVLRAAFIAADEGRSIEQQHLERAAFLEAKQLGLLVRE